MAIDITFLNNNSTANITTNFQRVEAALEEALSRTGNTPNQMNADLDLNDYNIINVGEVLPGTISAANYVTYAEEWANKAEDSLVSLAAGGNTIDEYSAKHWAAKAEDSKDIAEAQGTAATASAAAALASENAAATSETNAATSESNASTSETNAAASAAAADVAKIEWQGAYSGATAYEANDAVSYNGSSYICILASTGNVPTNVTYWELLAEKGTDGAGSGDMLAATYDPTSVAGDAFDMANMVESTSEKIFTSAERTKLAGIETGATVGGGGGLFKGDNGEVGTAPDDIFRINAQTLNSNVTIDADENASCTGPLAIADTYTITVASGGVLAVI